MKFLILDAGCAFHGQGGELNHLFTKVAKETLEAFGHEVAVTEVGGDWKVEEEHEKIRAAAEKRLIRIEAGERDFRF